MVKPEWGTKRACRKCAAHFYDLNKAEFVCPKCNASYTPQDYILKNIKATSEVSLKKDVRKKAIDPLDEQIDDLDEVLDTDLEEDLIEDTTDLGDDDMHEVMKHESDND